MLWIFVKFNHIARRGFNKCPSNAERTFDRALRATYHAPAMVNPLLERVLPADMAERSQVIEYKGEVGEFERLSAIVKADLESVTKAERPREWRAGSIEIRIEFSWLDARQSLAAASGQVNAEMAAVCQRCLEPFEMPIEAVFNVLFRESDKDSGQHADLADIELWEFEDETVRPVDIVEESLVMALPLAPMHESIELCGPLAKSFAEDETDVVQPFADLRSQMEKMNK